jgi:ribosomal-protein-alanine N-acetyltransferase
MLLPIQTSRCILRELKPSDASGMFELDSDPLVHRYLGNNPITSLDEAKGVIEFVRRQYAENGIGRWALIHRDSQEFMGWCGLKLNTEPLNGYTDYYDLGYRLIPRYWGQGFASEAGAAALVYGFRQLKSETVYAAAHTGNAASNRVLTKLGFEQTGTFQYDGEPCYWYELQAQRKEP